MNRHDPLSSLAPGEADPTPSTPVPPPKRRKGKAKLAPLLRELAAVADDTLAFLYGGPGQQPGDYERNQLRAPEIRRDFTAFCGQHPSFANWRQAWSAFAATLPPTEPAESSILTVDFEPACSQPVPIVPNTIPVQTSAPLWQQRARSRAALYRHET